MVAGLAVPHEESQSAHLRGNDRRAAGHGFQCHHPKRLVKRRHHQNFRGRIIIRQRVLRALAEEDHRLSHTQVVAQLLQAHHLGGHLVGVGIRLAADDRQIDGVEHTLEFQAGHGAQERVHAFERFDAPDEQDHALVRFQPDELPRFIFWDGIKVADVHAGRDDGHLVEVGLVEPLQLGFLRFGRDDEAVRALDDAFLALDAVRALTLGVATRDAVLHRAQGVEHVQDRRAHPKVRERSGGQSRHPVVAVDHIIADALLVRELKDAVHELRDVICQLAFRHRNLRPCGNMDDAVAEAEVVQNVRDVLILRAREHVHVDAHLAETARQVADVNVHPAGVLAAERCQRTGVIGKHGDVHI